MMKGNNTLMLNEATLIEAVQLLLDRDAPGAGKVTSVRAADKAKFEAPEFTVLIEVKHPNTVPA
jgi:hypothetical protein